MTRRTLDPEIIAKLSTHRALGSAPAHEHAWLATNGELRMMPAGSVAIRKGEPVPNVIIIFSGRTVVRVDHGAGPRKVLELGPGDVGGQLPYSRMKAAPGDGIIEEDTEALYVPGELTEELIRNCPVSTAA